MRNKIAFVMYYSNQNKSSFHAIVGAMETEEYLDDIDLYFIRSKGELVKDLSEIIESHEKVILGMSFFTNQIFKIYPLIKVIKEKYKDKITYIAGGSHATGDPEGTLKMGFDIVFIGEAEESIVEFFTRLKNDDDFKAVKGIEYISDRKYIYTGKRPNIDLDKYPPFAPKHFKFGHTEITRGCPFACSYCQVACIFGCSVRHRSIEKICEYSEMMRARHLKDFRVITPNAFSYGSPDGRTVNLKKLEELLIEVNKMYKPDGRIFIGSFPSEVRPEHVTEDTMELLKKYTDNKEIVMGAQSGSEKILKNCRRGHSVEDVYKAVRLSVKYKLTPYVDFIFGLPGEDEEDIKKTIKMMKDLVKLGAVIHAHTFTPLPSTPYSKSDPGVISGKIHETIRFISEESKDSLFGNWTDQEKEAKKISDYIRYGII